MRRLNHRLVLWLIVLGAAGGGLIYGLHSFQLQRHASVFLREAHRAQGKGNLRGSLDYFRRYLRLVPEDLDAQAEYGVQLAELGYQQAAFLTLDAVVRRRPERADLRRKLVEVGLRLGRYSDAETQLKPLLDESARDSELLILLATSQAGRHDYQSAVTTLKRAIEIAPQNLRAYELLASLLHQKVRSSAEANAALDQMVSSNPESADAYLIRARWRLDQSNFEGAKQDAESAAKFRPDETKGIIVLGRAALGLQKPVDARGLGLRAVSARPQDPDGYRLLADVELAVRDRAAAAEWLRKGVASAPEDLDLCWNLASLELELGNADQVSPLVSRLRAGQYQEDAIAFIEVRQRIARSEWLVSAKELERLRPSLGPWPELVRQCDYWLGYCYQELGNSDQQLVAMRRALAADPSWVPARLGVAEALLAAGKLQQAEEEYRLLASNSEVPVVASLNYVRLLIINNLRRPSARRDFAQVVGILDRLDQLAPENVDSKVLRAEVLVAQGLPDEGLNIIRTHRQKYPEDPAIWMAEIALQQRLRDWTSVDELAQAVVDRFGDSEDLRLIRARGALYRDGTKAKEQLIKLAEYPASWTAAQRDKAASGLALMNVAIGELEEARRLANSVVESQPNNLRIRVLLLDIAFKDRSPEHFDRALDGIKEVEGAGPIWRYGQAMKLGIEAEREQDRAKYVQANEHLAIARGLRPAWAKLPLLAAEFADRQNQKGLAADLYLESIELGERQPAVISRLMTLFFEQKRFVEADRLVRGFQDQQTPFSGDLLKVASKVSLQLEDFDRALDLAQQIARDSDRFEDHLWLGQVLGMLRRFDESEKQLRHATSLAASRPDAWISLVQVLSLAGRKEQATEVVQAAEAAIDPKEASLAAAQCYEMLGQNSQALERYMTALEDRPNDPLVTRRAAEYFLRQRADGDAERQLRRLLGLKAEDVDLAWARRSLASMVSRRGGVLSTQQALQLLERTSDSRDEADQRALAYVLARSSIRVHRQRAMTMLQELAAAQPNVRLDDRFLLAGLYSRDGQLSRANTELRSILASNPSDPRYLSTYLELLFERKEYSEVEIWLPKLKTAAKSDLPTVALECRLLTVRRRYDEARATLKSAADLALRAADSPSSTTASGSRVWAAQLAEQLARLVPGDESESKAFFDQSLALLEKEAQEVPQHALLLASFHLRTGDTQRALELAEQHAPGASDDMIVSFVEQSLMIGISDSAANQRLKKLLTTTRDGRTSTILDLCLANLMSWTGDYDEAQVAYRKLLAVEPNNIMALNGLAALLSSRGGDGAESVQLIERAISVAGPLGTFLDTRGLCRMAGKQLSEAQADFERAIQDEGAPDRHFHLALCYYELRNDDAARRALKEAEKAGLRPEKLHPLERAALQKLQEKLASTSDARTTSVTRRREAGPLICPLPMPTI